MSTILFLTGGKSAEREIALLSAQNIYRYLEPYNVLPVLVSASGEWLFVPHVRDWPSLNRAADDLLAVSLKPTKGGLQLFVEGGQSHDIDLIFPVMHGPFGEDGTVQGLAQFFGLPIVGSDMTGSLVNMDKVLMKAMLDQRGIPNARYRSFCAAELCFDATELATELFAAWECPSLYVKPARMGSSIGMTQVKRADELATAFDRAVRYDDKLLVEEGFCALELEIAVLEQGDGLLVSDAAQIRSRGEFYNFQQKYFPENEPCALEVEVHNDLPKAVIDRAKCLAEKAYKALGGCHYARVDLFYLEAEDRLLFNEINTIPGFTEHSMFPQLMAAEGWPMAKLVPHLVEMALQAKQRPSLDSRDSMDSMDS